MAKIVNAVVSASYLFGQIVWLAAKNFRPKEDYGTEGENKVVRNSLAEKEWVSQYPCLIYPIDEQGKKEALDERARVWSELKATAPTSEQAKAQLLVFEKVYTNNGKLLSPDFYGNSGFRRAKNFFDAMVQRSQAGENVSGLIPALLKNYSDEAERILDQQLENELRPVGAVEVSAVGKLKVVKHLFDMGTRQIRVREVYGHTTGQKLYGLCQINALFPDLKLIKRLSLPEDDKDFIPVKPIKHTDVTEIVNRYEAQVKRDEGKDMSLKERALPPINESEVDAFLRGKKVKAESGNAKKIMERKDIESFSNYNKLDIGKLVFKSVMEASTNPMALFLTDAAADAVNGVTTLVKTGQTAHANAAVALVNAGASVTLLNKLSEIVNAGLSARLEELLAPLSQDATTILQSRAQVATEQVATEQVATEQVATEQVATEQVATEQVATEQVATEQVATEQVAPEQVATEQVATEQVATQGNRRNRRGAAVHS